MIHYVVWCLAYLAKMYSMNARFRNEKPPFPHILGERPQKLCDESIIKKARLHDYP